MLTSSGQAANYYAIFNICEAGDHIVVSNSVYGGTFNLYGTTLKNRGLNVPLSILMIRMRRCVRHFGRTPKSGICGNDLESVTGCT